MSRLNVAIVAPSLRILGGQAVQADRLLRSWKGDHEVNAWLTPVNPLPPPLLRWTVRVKYLRTIVTECTYGPLLLNELARADLVHVFSASYFSFLLAPLPAILVARALGKPVVLNYRSGEAPDHLRRSALARAILARVDQNVVPSRFLVEVFSRFGIPATIVPNIVDLDRFAYRPRDPLRPRLLSTRNLDALYDVGTTIRAFRLVQDRWPEATLTLVGKGPEEASLRQQVSALGLRGVNFVGAVPPDAIADWYQANDIYIQSPTIDNMPTSVLEAFASGLPVVSTDAGGVPSILTHGVHGLLGPIGNHSALAAHVLSLLEDPPMARRLAASAHATCGDCTWTAVRDRWLDVYRGVLERAGNRSTKSAGGSQEGLPEQATHI
jgi:glycosyltransferase involved in cell wall biosynthesis